MKPNKITPMMKPGDMIEWVYNNNNKPVLPDAELWSNPMYQYVPIGGKALLISIADGIITWLSPKGLFHARVDDTSQAPGPRAGGERLFHARVDDTSITL